MCIKLHQLGRGVGKLRNFTILFVRPKSRCIRFKTNSKNWHYGTPQQEQTPLNLWTWLYLPGGTPIRVVLAHEKRAGVHLTRSIGVTPKQRFRKIQGRNEGAGKGTQFHGHRIAMRPPNDSWGAEKSQQCYKYFSSIQYISFRKTSGANMGAPNLLLVPGAI